MRITYGSADIKITDQSNATATLSNDSNIFIKLGLNEKWVMNVNAIVTTDSTGSFSFNLTGPAGCTCVASYNYISSIPAHGIVAIATRKDLTIGSAGEVVILNISISVINSSTAGVFNFQWSSFGLGSSVVGTGSNFQATRIT